MSGSDNHTDKQTGDKKQERAYQQLLDKLSDYVVRSEKIQTSRLYEMVDTTKQLWHAAGELTKDEIELVATYAKRDLSSFLHGLRHERKALRDWMKVSQLESAFYRQLCESSDQTQLEWHELAEDFRHQGIYHIGEVVGHGEFSCKSCGRSIAVYGPTTLTNCQHCGGREFERRAFKP